jgi:hypothetical protein
LRTCRTAMADTGRLLLVERGIRPANEPDPAKVYRPHDARHAWGAGEDG